MEKRKTIIVLTLSFLLCAICLLSINKVEAANKSETLTPEKYEVDSGSSFSFSAENKVNTFEYGQNSLGKLTISGAINDATEYGGVKAYGTSGNITFGYAYYNTFQSDVKDNWNLYSSDWFESKIVQNGKDIKTSKNINNGAIIIQKSSDHIYWENAASVSDFFDSKTTGRDSVYTTTEDELKQGTYYRIVVTYTMQKRTKTAWGPLPDSYDKKTFAEVYEVFLCSDNNYISVYNVTYRNELKLPDTVTSGFYITKNDSSATVTVKNGNGPISYAYENSTYTDAGEYTITVTTKLKKEYTYNITVNTGVSYKELEANTYDCEDNKGYNAENKSESTAECCIGNHMKLYVGHGSAKEVIKSNNNGVASYGVQGSAAELYVSLGNLSSGWTLCSDTWGKKEKELVDGVATGEVGTGAIIIQKSSNGKDWTRIDAGKYSNGLYTTDFEANYGTTGKILVYTPDGNDVINGTYYRVLYAYEVKKDKTIKNYLEEYVFYLCSASTDAVTFKNETLSDSLNESLSELDSSTADMYMSAETMLSGSYTTTGFTIDRSKNPTARVSVKKNGVWIGDNLASITETGRYDITVTSAVGNTQLVTIFVDREDNDSIYQRYFGASFIDGVRVFADGDYPVFEAGERTKYYIAKISGEYAPLYGTITNTSTEEVINIDASTVEKSGKILSAGEYEAVFSTNPTYATDNKSGDNRVFTFRFTVIEEGTAPGPVVNRQRLSDYAKSTVSDAYPIYYGLTYYSAKSGRITLAFATEKAAIDFAYNYEKGDAEEIGDGTYSYKGSQTQVNGEYQYSSGSFVKQKEIYENGWTLADAIYNYAKQSVQKSFFNYGSLYSLSEDVIETTENLRQLELNQNVVVFADASQKSVLTDLDCLPIISDKLYLYSVPGDSEPESGYIDFEFTRDIYGADSYEVVITDKNGKEYKIEYNKSVGSQLEAAGCPSGIITIVETTKYGQKSEPYNAVYIAKGENTGIVTIAYENNGTIKTNTYSQNSCDEVIVCDCFTLDSIQDELDPYGLITVSSGKNTSFFAANETFNGKWVLPSEYTVTYKNRLGYAFQIVVQVRNNDNAVIAFEGASSEDISSINTSYGSKNVKLPKAERYGYEFVGYVDSEGNIYADEISSILFKGEMVLSTTWKPKKFVLTTEVNGTEQKYEISYGKQIDLPKPDLPDGYELIGWTLDGEEYAENTFTLTEEKNVKLKAIIKKLANESEPSDEEKNDVGITEHSGSSESNDDTTEKKGNYWWILIVILVVGSVGGFFGYKYLWKKKPEN